MKTFGKIAELSGTAVDFLSEMPIIEIVKETNPNPEPGERTMATKLRTPHAAANLADLCEILNEWAEAIAYEDIAYDAPGRSEYDDLSSLPTFGGSDIDNTSDVFSWDSDSVLVSGDQITVAVWGWTIEDRCSICGEAKFHCDHDDE